MGSWLRDCIQLIRIQARTRRISRLKAQKKSWLGSIIIVALPAMTSSTARIAPPAARKDASKLPADSICFREDAGRCGSLADSDCIFGIAFLRGCYHKILRPRRHIPKFGNGLCRHPDIWVYFDPHLIWQACKGYVECSNVLRIISHQDLPPRLHRAL